MELNLQGRSFVISGGSGALGSAIARRFADEGVAAIASSIMLAKRPTRQPLRSLPTTPGPRWCLHGGGDPTHQTRCRRVWRRRNTGALRESGNLRDAFPRRPSARRPRWDRVPPPARPIQHHGRKRRGLPSTSGDGAAGWVTGPHLVIDAGMAIGCPVST